MSKSLLNRIEALERERVQAEPLIVIFRCLCEGEPLTGYQWQGIKIMRKAGESEAALFERARASAQPVGGVIALSALGSA